MVTIPPLQRDAELAISVAERSAEMVASKALNASHKQLIMKQNTERQRVWLLLVWLVVQRVSLVVQRVWLVVEGVVNGPEGVVGGRGCG